MMHRLDTSFASTAIGFGTSRILGRVPPAELEIIDEHGMRHVFKIEFKVLEDCAVDLLFGLDSLKKFGCSIDLEDSKLRFRTPE
jgi:Aspartyl protease